MLKKFIYMFHMPLFFLVSGFCFTYHDSYKQFICKKINRILIPYLAFGVLDILPRIMLSSLVHRSGSLGYQLEKIIFYGGSYWFLYTLFIIFAIYPLVYYIYKRNLFSSLLVTGIIILFALASPDIKIFTLGNVVYHLLYFHLGCIMRLHMTELRKIIASINSCLAAMIAAFLIASSMVYVFGDIYITCIRIFFAFIGCSFCGLFTYSACFNNFWGTFGKYSLQLYLLNGFTLGVSRTIICYVLRVQNPLLIIIFNVFVDFFLSYLFVRFACVRWKFSERIMGL